MEQALLQYGAIGVMLIGMSAYILRIEARHKKERKEWMDMQSTQFDRMNELSDESNKVIREHTNILIGLKTLLENRK